MGVLVNPPNKKSYSNHTGELGPLCEHAVKVQLRDNAVSVQPPPPFSRPGTPPSPVSVSVSVFAV